MSREEIDVTTPDVITPRVRAGRSRRMDGLLWVVILGALSALGPLSNDAYLPGWPQIAASLHTSPSAVQLSLTACLLGLGLGQVLAGPISDALGRKLPLVAGLVLYVAASLLCAVASSIWLLVALRLVQGIGGATGIVLAAAIVRDRRAGLAAARLFAVLILITGLGPVLGPVMGGQILRFSRWPGIFVALAIVGGVMLLAVVFGLGESLPAEGRQRGGLAAMPSMFGRLLADRVFVGYMLASGLAFGAMFAYIAGSPFVLQDIHHLTPQQYSLVFGGNALGLVIAAQVSGRIVHRVGARLLLGVGVAGSAAGGLTVLGAVLAHAGLPALLAGMFIVVASVGLVMPNSMALALNDHGDMAGTAAALIGVAQYLTGAIVAPLAGLSGATAAVPMSVVMAVLSVGALLAFGTLVGIRTNRAAPLGTGRVPVRPTAVAAADD
jgi:DHA1 family bicyclomycin/chloramphenicol resistance-like MFS transporter